MSIRTHSYDGFMAVLYALGIIAITTVGFELFDYVTGVL